MPQTFAIASRTTHIKGFTVKSSCNQHRIDPIDRSLDSKHVLHEQLHASF